jgi:hypothetical protein
MHFSSCNFPHLSFFINFGVFYSNFNGFIQDVYMSRVSKLTGIDWKEILLTAKQQPPRVKAKKSVAFG